MPLPDESVDRDATPRGGSEEAGPHGQAHSGQVPVKGNTRVSKAKFELLGRIDRHAHMSRLAGVLVPTDHVLKDEPQMEHVHCSAHIAIQGMCRLTVRRLAQFGRVQDVKVTKCLLVQTDRDLVLLKGANSSSNQIAIVLRVHNLPSRTILVSQRARQVRHHHRGRHPKIGLGIPVGDWRKPTRQVK